jgi:arylsulfatase A-like enzyme
MTVERRPALIVAALLLAALAASSRADAKSAQPNFVILLADDLGYGDLGAYGHPTIATPNLDRMAAEGLKLTSFYAMPLCTPSRAALLTGRFPNRSGLYRVLFPEDTVGIPAEEVTIAEALAASGYRTAAIGKWHLGHHSPYLPTENGFASYFGLLYSNDMRPPRTEVPLRLYRDAEALTGEVDQGTLTERYTEEAVRIIREAGDRPLLLYLAYTMPHMPVHASERFAGRSRRGRYGDAVETIDWSVGEILGALRDAGLESNTLVLFTSDNGPATSRGLGGGSAGLLRGSKGSSYEGGVREPCIARWPSRIAPAQVRADVASTLDLFPTLLELAEVAAAAAPALDGRSLAPLLDGRALEPDRPFYYFKAGFLEAVRDGKWKFRETALEGSGREHAAAIDTFLQRTLSERRSFTAAEVLGGASVPELYDLDADPAERFNLAAEHPEIVERLRRRMTELAPTVAPGAAFDVENVDPAVAERRRRARREEDAPPDAEGGTTRP